MSSDINWTALVDDKKGILTLDNVAWGKVIGEREDSIIIQKGSDIYKVPKDKVIGYDGAEVTINLKPVDLKAYELEKTKDGEVKSMADSQ